MEVWNLVCCWDGGQREGVGCKCLLIDLEDELTPCLLPIPIPSSIFFLYTINFLLFYR